MSICFLTVDDALKIHDSRIALYGGSLGVRDYGLLESAILVSEQAIGEDYLHTFPFEMAAAYLFHIAKNHPFLDGNKRTALACCLIFLRLNGYEVIADEFELETLVLNTATGKAEKKRITQFLSNNSRLVG